MCRVVGVFLKPRPLEQLVLEQPVTGGNAVVREAAVIFAALRKDQEWLQEMATDCAKKSTKAGYDAAGVGVGVLDLRPLLEALPQAGQSLSQAQLKSLLERFTSAKSRERLSPHILLSKDGGDFLETHGRLNSQLGLEPHHCAFSWTVHIRQASQGDMYSSVNAHPHAEMKAAGDEGLRSARFFTMHNGDILDADRYKKILVTKGFQFLSNADSCVIPAVQRFFHDALTEKNGIAAALKAFREVVPPMNHERLERLPQCAKALLEQGAEAVTVASAMAARLFELSNPENKFLFQSLSPLGEAAIGFLGGGTVVVARGGFQEGGEEGAEAIFHLPYPEDETNFARVAALVASEENALKDKVRLIDPEGMRLNGSMAEAQPQIEELKHLQKRYPELQARTLVTEGTMPIFDVQPGEILEVRADGKTSLYDMYSGEALGLKRLRPEWPAPGKVKGQLARKERMVRLKRFRVEYKNAQNQPMPPPFNTYGEEIIVVQPKALRDNTQKLFRKNGEGLIELIPGRQGLGLWMGTDDRGDRSKTLRRVDFKLTGAAGTSFLMAQIAENMCRKLRLNRIPAMVLEGFTGSDAIPPNVSQNTLFVANSNSGGTSDTIKLTRELNSLIRICENLLEHRERGSAREEWGFSLDEIEKIYDALKSGTPEAELNSELIVHLRHFCPHVFVITNIEASPLGDMGRGVDGRIYRPAGTGVTNLPEEECVGSTFAAMASLQWMMTLDTYLGEIRNEISHQYAREIYTSLAKLPDVCDRIVNHGRLADEIREFADRCVGGNNDFIYTDYVIGVPEEQAHKFAEMIQTMAVGWHYFMFQHGKYAHVRRASRHALGSIVGHNVPPPSWPFFHGRALKAPREIKARAAIMFAIAHESDREALLAIPDYAVDYVFTYPEDDKVLYPFQAIIVSHLISYYWGIELKKISDQIALWNERFIALLKDIARENNGAKSSTKVKISAPLARAVRDEAAQILVALSDLYTDSHRFDTVEVRRMNAIFRDLHLLSEGASQERTVAIEKLLGSPKISLQLQGSFRSQRELSDQERLTILKDLALELSTAEQAKRIADIFLTEADGRVMDVTLTFKEVGGHTRTMKEYDYWCQYEGLGEFYHVNPIHPPKIAKAKKGWL